MKPVVGIIMGSDSDLPVMAKAAEMLDQLQVPYECTIVSAHRTPGRLCEYAKQAEERGIRVIIAGAGGAAHLPGMTAAMTVLPVIGVPVQTKALSGVDSLYSIVQMPPGIPVATVAINGADVYKRQDLYGRVPGRICQHRKGYFQKIRGEYPLSHRL